VGGCVCVAVWRKDEDEPERTRSGESCCCCSLLQRLGAESAVTVALFCDSHKHNRLMVLLFLQS